MHSPQNGYISIPSIKPPLSPKQQDHKGCLSSSSPSPPLDFDLPTPLRQYLTTTSKPNEIFSQVEVRNDRRLRLLIRRYVNQIQHGCKNTKCEVPTCLSYRKRKSKGPLRKYTDLSARALACSLVEQYGQQGKEFETGLCWNDPVVPWYEDPVLVRERRQTITRRDGPGRRRSSNVEKEDTGFTYHRRFSSARSPGNVGVNKAQDLERPHRHPEHRQASNSPSSVTQHTTYEDSAPGVIERIGTLCSASAEHHGCGPGENSAPEQLYSETSPAEKGLQSEVKDPASFTQNLFDLSSLRDLNSLTARAHKMSEQEEPGKDHIAVVDSYSKGDLNESHAQSTTFRPGVLTFKLLPFGVLKWLRDTVRSRRSEIPRIHDFILQSLHYCLSDPVRLTDSSAIWGSPNWFTYEMQPSQHENSEDPGATARPSLTDQHGEAASRTGPVRDIDGIDRPTSRWNSDFSLNHQIYALDLLHEVTPDFKLLSYLHEALQKTFFVPNLSDRTALESVNGFARSKRKRKQDKLIDRHEKLAVDVCLLAFFASLFTAKPHKKVFGHLYARALCKPYVESRKSGISYPSLGKYCISSKSCSPMIELVDISHDWRVVRLIEAIASAVGHWTNIRQSCHGQNGEKTNTIANLIVKQFSPCFYDKNKVHNMAAIGAIDLFRDVLLDKWDRSSTIRKVGPVWGALCMLSSLFKFKADLKLRDENFHMPFIADTFDKIDMPVEWLSFRADNRKTHILAFSFLFEPARLVEYFRAVNLEVMRKSYENACIVYTNARQFLHGHFPIYGAKEVLTTMRPHMARYFVLSIRRDNVMEDAINQVWRRQRQELMRPLRLRLGFEEGEEGVDHGGVQQEFFRILFAQALAPEYGVFSTDHGTRMTWFQPGSPEQLYKIEALGVLFSLAIYNCVTLPVTFPLAFYRRLLGQKVKRLEHIQDGWPELAKNLQILLDWSDGDVGDTISRTYEFSYEAFGTTVSIDMQKVGKDDIWPQPARKRGKEKAKTASFGFPPSPTLTPSSMSPHLEPNLRLGLSRTTSLDLKGTSTPDSITTDLLDSESTLVTNANREQYVKDYIFWLTDKSIRPQYEAFSKGIFTCLDRTALSIFTAEAFKRVVEGYQEIDINELERSTSYEGFERDSDVIKNFWSVVRSYSPDQHKKLLEFVTASARVPVTGISSIKFEIDKNGEDDKMLPTSSTCYGRLLLPEYSSIKVLEEKLTYAIENAVGFGSY